MKTIFNRRSTRSFNSKRISHEQLESLLCAGMAAPSAVNKQPWAFVVIDNRVILDELGEALPYAKMLHTAQAAIVVCGDMTKALPDWQQEYWIQDCSAATQNILIQAEEMGLATVWTGVYPGKDRVKIIREKLGLPEHIIPLNVIPIGYPEHEEKPKNKYNTENIHWNNW